MHQAGSPDPLAVLQELPDLVFAVGADATVTFVNDAATDLGWSPAEVVGRSSFDFVHPDDVPIMVRAFENTSTKAGRAIPLEVRVLAKAGTWHSYEIVASNQLDGASGSLLVVARDLTDRYTYERSVRHNPESLRAMVNGVNDLLFFVDDTGEVQYANRAVTRLLDVDLEDVVGTRFESLLHADTAPASRHALTGLIATAGSQVVTEVAMCDIDGAAVPFEVNGTNLTRDLVVGGIVLLCRDLRAARQAEREFRNVLTALDEAFVVFEGGVPVFANEAARHHFRSAFGAAAEAPADITRPGLDLLAARLVHEDGSPIEVETSALFRAVAFGEPFEPQVLGFVPLDDGEPVTWISIRGSVVELDGRTQVVLSGFDLTPRKALEDELRRSEARYRELSLHDPLTGLANNRLVDELLAHAVESRDGRAGVVFVDLDHFKDINDTYGHAVGDRVLVAVAERLAQSTRNADTPGRRGGDEFVVVCEGLAGAAELSAIVERLSEAIRRPLELDGVSGALRPSASIGAALQSDDGTDPDALLQAADAALYEVKASGRNGWQLASTP